MRFFFKELILKTCATIQEVSYLCHQSLEGGKEECSTKKIYMHIYMYTYTYIC